MKESMLFKNILPLHHLTKRQIYRQALTLKGKGQLYDTSSPINNEIFNGSIDRFCEIAARLKYSRKVLDIGAGNGILVSLLSSLGHECYTVDINSPADAVLDMYKAKGIQFQICNVEIDHLPFPDSAFNAVVCCQVLEHFTHSHLEVMREIHRVLTLGGLVEIDVPNAVCFRNRSRMLRGKHITWDYKEHYLYSNPVLYKGYSFYPLRHNREFTKDELELLLNASSFRSIDVYYMKSRRHREGLKKVASIGSSLRDAIPSFRKTLIAFGVKDADATPPGSERARNKQKWLVLSHAFNMDGRAASQTITDKIPHLLAKGIEPVVLSSISSRKDEKVAHYRIPPLGPAGLRFDLRHLLRQYIRNRATYRLLMGLFSLLTFPVYMVEALLIRLEVQWSWFLSAYLAGSRAVSKHKPALIYSTGGANSAHVAGYLLARRFGLPWIAEIHDPLVLGSKLPTTMRERFTAWVEKIVCRHADVVWWFTEEALARAKARHPELGNRGYCLIPGADKPSIVRLPYRRSSRIVIAHFGSLSETRNLEFFLSGLRRMIDKYPERRDMVRLHVYGSKLDPVSSHALHEFPYPEMVACFGRLEFDAKTGESGRDRALKLMNSADCLLLLHGNEPFCEEYIPSKLYEYFWTQRPILALAWCNPQMESMLRSRGHWVVQADDANAIAATLDNLYERWTNNELADLNSVSPYTVEAAVQALCAWAYQVIVTCESNKRSCTKR